jgi:hypothetical protein
MADTPSIKTPNLMSGVKTSVNTNINDIINHANSVVCNDIYELNKEFFDGYQWIAALDSTTCLACAGLDGKIFDGLPGGSTPAYTVKDYTEAPEIPLHKNCRCIIVPVLEGMRDDPSQIKINYKGWFDSQDNETKLDILGPSRYKEYLNGKPVTAFAKDGRIKTLEELGIDRIKRADLVFEETRLIILAAKEPNEVLDLYTEELTKEQLIRTFEMRHPNIKLNIDKDAFTKENLRIVLSENDRLLTEYPKVGELKILKLIGNANTETDNNLRKYPNTVAYFDPSNNKIIFNDKYNKKNWALLNQSSYAVREYSSPDANAAVLHEFAHAMDLAHKEITGKFGREHLLSELKKVENIHNWKSIANIYVSTYARKKNTGSDFFADAFTAWKNGEYSMTGLRQGTQKHKIYQFFNDFFTDISSVF